jgi:hypothetical protein
MSNFIQVQQPFGRIDPDTPGRRVDVDADFGGERNEHLAAAAAHNEPAPSCPSLDALDVADRLAIDRDDRTAHELMVVVLAGLQRL